MAIKKSQLYSALWESCNALRGSMDASQYKDYVLIILFVKYLSDKAGQPGFRLKVPEECRFKDFVALKQNSKIGELINQKLEAIKEMNARQIGDLALPNFNDPNKLGSGKTMVETLSKLIAVFENDALDFSRNRAADDDLLGDAYEYLMKNFAAESGKSKGQFYTPAEVSRVMAKVLRINELDRAEQTIYDPTCGSGSLLLRALAEASNPRVSICGQEKDSSTAALAKLNMLLHGISNAEIKVGDTLGDPQFKQYGMLSTFDVCVANPPFSQKNWLASDMVSDQYNRWTTKLLPPAKCGDYAFLLHLICSMRADVGRGACILPHGVLFRGNAEYDIRKDIVEKHYIKGIIGLPPNIFFGTGIPASIIIIDKKDKDIRKGIFYIDAKDGFAKDGAKNRLREQDIKRIVDAWEGQQPIVHYCRMVEWDEIERNDFNLNISRYIQPVDGEIQQDIEAHLHGGLPAADIDSMEIYWKACPTLKDALFSDNGNGYYSLNPQKEAVTTVIDGDNSYKAQGEAFAKVLDGWKEEVEPKMMAINQGVHPKDLIAEWSESLLAKTKGHSGLVDAYDAYDVLLNYWAATMQDDCYMISNDGWTYPEVRAVKRKEVKEKNSDKTKVKETAVMYDEIVCDLLPVNIVLDEFFSSEKKAIAELKGNQEDIESHLQEMQEEHEDDFSGYDKLTEIKAAYKSAVCKKPQLGEKEVLMTLAEMPTNNKETKQARSEFIAKHQEIFADWDKFGKSDIKRRLNEIETYHPLLPETLSVFKEYIEKNEELTVLKSLIKEQSAALTQRVVEKYADLTEDEIKMLVVSRKWLASVIGGCEALMQTVTHRIGTEIVSLVERYEHTLPELANEVNEHESEVNGYLAEMGFTL